MPPIPGLSDPSLSTAAEPSVALCIRALAEVKSISAEWFDYIVHGVASLPREPTQDDVWRNYAMIISFTTRLCRKLMYVVDGPPGLIEDITATKADGNDDGFLREADAKELKAHEVIRGAVRHSIYVRFALFSNRCQEMPSPDTSDTGNLDDIPEIIMYPTDHFNDCSRILPGYHGWIFVFRRGLEKTLLQTSQFCLVHQQPLGQKRSFGVYQALRWREADLTGPEFLSLKTTVRQAITAHISNSPIGSQAFNKTHQDFIQSKITVPCILLRCLRARGVVDPAEQDLAIGNDTALRLRELITKAKGNAAARDASETSTAATASRPNRGSIGPEDTSKGMDTADGPSGVHPSSRGATSPPPASTPPRFYIGAVPYNPNTGPTTENYNMSRFDAASGGYTPSGTGVAPAHIHHLNPHGQSPNGNQRDINTTHSRPALSPMHVHQTPSLSTPGPQFGMRNVISNSNFYPVPGDFAFTRHTNIYPTVQDQSQMTGVSYNNCGVAFNNNVRFGPNWAPDRDQSHWAPGPPGGAVRITRPPSPKQDITANQGSSGRGMIPEARSQAHVAERHTVRMQH